MRRAGNGKAFCRKCRQPKGLAEDFGTYKSSAGRLMQHRVCRECRLKQKQVYREANKESIRQKKQAWDAANQQHREAYEKERYARLVLEDPDYIRKQAVARYGITLEDHARMLSGQQRKCAICGRDDSDLVIDHDHETGKVRALLCNLCNLGLGKFKDDPDLLLAAAAYLLQHKEVTAGNAMVT